MNQILLLEKAALKDEVRKLNEQEDDIIKKALEVEQEMNSLKNKKLQVVVGMYQDQLAIDFTQQQEKFSKEQAVKLREDLKALELEKTKKLKMLDGLYVRSSPKTVFSQVF